MIKATVFDTPSFIKIWKKMRDKYRLPISSKTVSTPSFSLGKQFCDAGKLYLSISPDGTVIPCPTQLSCAIGNISDKRFIEIWKKGLQATHKQHINKCAGYFCRSTIEVSRLMRKNPVQLLLEAPQVIIRHKLLR